MLIWDDAGLWLMALEHWHPFVRAVIKYLNVARTNWASLIFTTPLPTWVIKKIRGFPQAVTLKIIKTRSDKEYPNRERMARAFRYWVSALGCLEINLLFGPLLLGRSFDHWTGA